MRKRYIIAVAVIILGFAAYGLFFAQEDGEREMEEPRCGDGTCDSGECQEGCGDCTPEDCSDGVCDTESEDCKNSIDCFCPFNSVCSPDRKTADLYGCAPVQCGDGSCDRDYETKESCCKDCGCDAGYLCQNNVCFVQPPKLAFSAHLLEDSLSATTLAANPHFTNETGVPHPLVALVFRNTGPTASGVTVKFEIPGFISETLGVGTVSKGEEIPLQWYLEDTSEFIKVHKDTRTRINVTVDYRDDSGVVHTIRRSYRFTIKSRNTLDEKYGHFISFVTPGDIDTNAATAPAIWEELRGKVTLEEHEGVQFPAETLLYGKGSEQDVLILLASAYENQGLQPGFLTARNNKTYLWVRHKGDFDTLDVGKFDQPYGKAVVDKVLGVKAVTFIGETLTERNLVPLSFDLRLIPGRDIKVTKDVRESCECDNGCDLDVVANYNVTNNGLSDADLCANSTFYIGNAVKDVHSSCFTVPGEKTEQLVHKWEIIRECDEVTAVFEIRNSTG